MKLCYKTEDGKIFDTVTECIQYETEKLNIMEDTKNFIKRVKSFCRQFHKNCEGCPFYQKRHNYFSCMFKGLPFDEGSPLDWDD